MSVLKEFRFGDFYIRHAIDDAPDDEPFKMHIHELCEIFFFVAGNVEYMVEGSRYPLEENSLMVIRPAEVHKPRILGPERYERYAVNFPLDFPSGLDPERRLLRPFVDRPLGKNNMLDGASIDAELVRKLFDEMLRDGQDDYDRLLAIKSGIITMLGLLCRAFDSQEKTEDHPRSTAERIVAYVNRHIFEPLSVPELAKHFYLSPSQFNRIFKQATGASPWEYITIKRLTAAKEKIHSGSPAQSASEVCGFKDYSTFYRAYTKYYGYAPTER